MYPSYSQVVLVVKNLPANAGRYKGCEFDPWVGKILWRRKWQPPPVFSPGESHAQRSLVGYSPKGQKVPDVAEVTALTSGAPVSVCLTTGEVNPEHVVRLVAARPLLCKVTIFPFVNNHLWGNIL